ncbi:MAG: acetyl-CoA carboxylase, carboxyltransferase subunit beta [Candidatus Anammoxibacter sp.]
MSLFRKKKSMPNGLWIRCNSCACVLYKKKLEQTSNVCPECDHHFRIGSKDRLKMMLDEGSFEEYWSSMTSADPLNFVDRIPYKERILNEQDKTGMKAACVAGKGKIYGREVMFAVTDPGFVMGSMGSVVGEKITRTAEKAFDLKVPLILLTGSGGGARMQEGVISLMQMAKTSAAIAKLQGDGGLYIIVITDPTLGGVMASFASQADIIIAEPGALIGFAGPRVIEQTIRKKLPPGFQTSEFMLNHGFIDMIVGRNDLKDKVSKLLNYLCEQEKEDEITIQSENNNSTVTLQTANYSGELVAS